MNPECVVFIILFVVFIVLLPVGLYILICCMSDRN